MSSINRFKNILAFSAIICFLLTFNNVSAQSKFRFGLKAAPLVSWIKPDFQDIPADFTSENGGLRVGFMWGPMAEIALSETFLVSTGVDINYTSGKIEGTLKDPISGSLVEWDQLYKTRFIELPVMLKFRTKEIGYLRYFGLFGMGAGFRYSASTEFSRSSNTSTETINNDDSEKYIKSFRGSLQIGAGAEYSLAGNTALVVSVIFNNGLTNMLQNQFEEPIVGSLVQDPFNAITENGITNYMQLNIGILF
ncbi:MAG: porin family protein [Bacteroidia bacterium]